MIRIQSKTSGEHGALRRPLRNGPVHVPTALPSWPFCSTLRSGFTLVEMLVAMALVIFVMLLLTQAFVAGLESFRQLKAIGDMDSRLRSITSILRSDLGSYRNGSGPLSALANAGFTPPSTGFFRIWQGGPSILEGTDGDGLPSYYATNHALQFTVNLNSPNDPSGYFVTDITPDSAAYSAGGWAINPLLGTTDSRFQTSTASGSTFTSPWVEVAYFLSANGDSANGTSLYSLYRRMRLVTSPSISAYSIPSTEPSTAGLAYAEVSCSPTAPSPGTAITFNDPTALTNPANRLGATGSGNLLSSFSTLSSTFGTTSPVAGSDLLVSDVISLTVQVFAPEINKFAWTSNPVLSANPNFTGSNPVTQLPANYVPVAPDTALGAAGSTYTLNTKDFSDLWQEFTDPTGANPVYLALGQNSTFAPGVSASNPAPTTFPAYYGAGVYDTWSASYTFSPAPPLTSGYAGGALTTFYSSNTSSPIGTTSGTTAYVPLPMGIQALKITLRVWDKRTESARQVTLIQAM